MGRDRAPGPSPVWTCELTGHPSKRAPGPVWPPPGPGSAPFDCSLPFAADDDRTMTRPRATNRVYFCRLTDLWLGQRFSEPGGDEIQDGRDFTPHAHAVQQLVVLHRHNS